MWFSYMFSLLFLPGSKPSNHMQKTQRPKTEREGPKPTPGRSPVSQQNAYEGWATAHLLQWQRHLPSMAARSPLPALGEPVLNATPRRVSGVRRGDRTGRAPAPVKAAGNMGWAWVNREVKGADGWRAKGVYSLFLKTPARVRASQLTGRIRGLTPTTHVCCP